MDYLPDYPDWPGSPNRPPKRHKPRKKQKRQKVPSSRRTTARSWRSLLGTTITTAVATTLLFHVMSPDLDDPSALAPGKATHHGGVTTTQSDLPDAVRYAGNTTESTPVRSGMGINIRTWVNTRSDGTYVYDTHDCSLGPVLDNGQALTAGHCISSNTDAVVDPVSGVLIATVVRSTYGNGPDVALLQLTDNIDPAEITTDILETSLPAPGDTVSKTGATTGTTSGPAGDNQPTDAVVGDRTVRAATAHLCALPGDSGGVVRNAAGNAIGVVSFYTGARDQITGDPDTDRAQCTTGAIGFGYTTLKDAIAVLRI